MAGILRLKHTNLRHQDKKGQYQIKRKETMGKIEVESIREAYLRSVVDTFTDAFNEGYRLGQEAFEQVNN